VRKRRQGEGTKPEGLVACPLLLPKQMQRGDQSPSRETPVSSHPSCEQTQPALLPKLMSTRERTIPSEESPARRQWRCKGAEPRELGVSWRLLPTPRRSGAQRTAWSEETEKTLENRCQLPLLRL